MANPYFRFKQFTIWHNHCAMKVSTDSVILGAWADPSLVNHILDIGTGTGILALMLAQRCPASIDAVEIDPKACLQATENVKLSPWNHRIRIIQSPLQTFANEETTYDLILTNPPFFTNSLKSNDPARNLARHNDSLSPSELLFHTSRLLSENGRFLLIIPANSHSRFISEATLAGLYCSRTLHISAYANRKPNRVVLELTTSRSASSESSLFIRNPDGEYSEAYKALTREYYLNF